MKKFIRKRDVKGVIAKSRSFLKDTEKKANDVAWKMRLNPKETTKEGLAVLAENPISVSSQALASPIAMGITSPVGSPILSGAMGLYPHSSYWIKGEQELKKKFPKYARVTKNAGNKVRKSETVDALLGKSPKVTARNSGPNSSFGERVKYNLRSGISDISQGIQTAGKSGYNFLQKMASDVEDQKNYTIQEGHYTGPKDMEKVPSTIEVIGKSALGGSGVGAITGSLLKDLGVSEDSGLLEGAKKGGKIGFISGIVLKALLNHLHKPMSKIKFQEVDRNLRKEFGMFRVAGVTFGDTRDKRKSFDDKFGTNDREVTKYPINICIHNNQVTMYTLNISDDQLNLLNGSLDYYCKKYSGMEYSSRVINSKNNTYSVNIIFTNYEAISSFILEISDNLGIRINLLNNDVLPETRIGKGELRSEERVYSNLPGFTKYDLSQIFLKSGARAINSLALNGPAYSFKTLVIQTILNSLDRLNKKEQIRITGGDRKYYDNAFLISELKNLGYIEGPHFTIDAPKSDLNISMICGKVVITTDFGSKSDLLIPKVLGSRDYKKTEINGKVNLWTFLIDNKGSFDVFLKSLVGTLKPNIYNDGI